MLAQLLLAALALPGGDSPRHLKVFARGTWPYPRRAALPAMTAFPLGFVVMPAFSALRLRLLRI